MAITLNTAQPNNAIGIKKSLKERLLSKIKIDTFTECWEWTGSKDTNGYGSINTGGGCTRAHRVSFMLHNGDIPERQHVCHRCDNRRCINPKHLFLASHAENMADRNAKNRQAKLKGTANGQAKLTESDVRTIRSVVGASQYQIAKQYGVSQALVWRIRAGKCWTHV